MRRFYGFTSKDVISRRMYYLGYSLKKLEEYKIMPLLTTPVSDAQVSSDGTKILFTSTKVNYEEDKNESHIWLLNIKEKEPKQFTFGKSSESNPRWSPDNKTLIFTSSRQGENDKKDDKPKLQLFIMSVDGGEAKKLTYREDAVRSPKWSPNGKTVAFTSRVFKGEKMKDSDVKIITRIRYKENDGGFFQGKYIHLFTVDIKTGKIKQLTDGLFDVESYCWGPDSKKIAFVTNMDPDSDLKPFKDIYVMPSKGGEPQRIWKGEGPISGLGWSPNGNYLAFTGRVIEDPKLNWFRNSEVWIYDIKAKKTRSLTQKLDQTIGGRDELKWSSDSEWIYFTVPEHGTTNVNKINLEGKIEPLITGKINVSSFDLDENEKILAYTASDDITPSELYIKDENGAKRATFITKGLMKKITIIPPEEFWFTASDGVKIQGWVVKPLSYKKGNQYPTILEIHGGPRSAYGFTFGPAEHEFQTLAQYDYGVVYTNPRASIGYGEEFSRAVSGHWGERDYQDLMEAMDYVLKHYDWVDSNRLGCAGGSYGGYMTNWIVGHTNRFKAAVTMRSVTSWTSMYGTSDIWYNDHDINWGKLPWTNSEKAIEKSPITYVDKVNTPLLILHSENDYRCPMEQAEQLFTALKMLGKTVEFVRFPDETHELSRSGKPKHRVERLRHIVRWFDRYLK
jgi:dipeptidyl aminopeptidase/acylaminoacyl peptidase